jgi:hypothetical protein
MSSIDAIGPAAQLRSIFAPFPQANGIAADSGRMDPIKGTDVSLPVAEIAIQAQGDANKVEMAKAKLVLDTMRDSGAQLVSLLENLGQNVNLYA